MPLPPLLLQRSCRAPGFKCSGMGSRPANVSSEVPRPRSAAWQRRKTPEISLGFAAHAGGSLRGGRCSASVTAPCQVPALPVGNSSLVLFSLSFLLWGKGQILPSIAWCPRNTPSFPDPSLVACSRLLPFLPGAIRVSLQPHSFRAAAHMCRCCFDG